MRKKQRNRLVTNTVYIEQERKRNREIVTFRMKIAIKHELDLLCDELKMSRSNFILNCVVKEMHHFKSKNKNHFKKKLENINFVEFVISNLS